jgi:hypothetical protein
MRCSLRLRVALQPSNLRSSVSACIPASSVDRVHAMPAQSLASWPLTVASFSGAHVCSAGRMRAVCTYTGILLLLWPKLQAACCPACSITLIAFHLYTPFPLRTCAFLNMHPFCVLCSGLWTGSCCVTCGPRCLLEFSAKCGADACFVSAVDDCIVCACGLLWWSCVAVAHSRFNRIVSQMCRSMHGRLLASIFRCQPGLPGMQTARWLLGILGATKLLGKAERLDCLLACCCATTTPVQHLAYWAVYDGRVDWRVAVDACWAHSCAPCLDMLWHAD